MKVLWLIRVFLMLMLFTSPASGQEFDGVWRTQGYGFVVQIDNGQLTIFNETDISFYPAGSFPISGDRFNLGENPDEQVFTITLEGDQLIATHSTSRLVLDRLDALPPIRGTDPGPVNVFNVFWQVIQENFASFSLLGLDWNEVRSRYRSRLSAGMSDSELFQLLGDMGAELLDGHTTIENTTTGWFRNTGPRPSLLGDVLSWDVMNNVAQNFLDTPSFRLVPGDDRIRYGTLENGRIGYLAIIDFEYRSRKFAQSLDRVFTDLAGTEMLLIDLRHHFGGDNWHALDLANRLTDQRRHVLTRVVRTGGPDEFDAPAEYFAEPEGVTYNNRPVYLLTNDGTASAGDVASLMLSSLPTVTQVGEATRGMFSQLTRLLPNGWVMTTTNERFLSLDGINYEYQGIEPELEVINTVAALNRGEDEIIEAAIEHLNARQALPAGSIQVTTGMSGNWFAPEHDGEGFVLEVLNDITAVIYWFTYAPSEGKQLWMIGVGEIAGDEIRFADVIQPFGASFGNEFDPDDVNLPSWGDLTLRFSDCNSAVASYSGPDEFGANFLSVIRLTGHVGAECDGPTSPISNLLSGSWFDPSRSGEGWTISQINEQTAVGLWFTFNTSGEPMWLIGVGGAG